MWYLYDLTSYGSTRNCINALNFSAWGEGTFLAIQTSIIAALVLQYGGSPGKATAFLDVYVGLVATLVSGYTPIDVLWNMQALTVPIVLIAKVSNFVISLDKSSYLGGLRTSG